MSMNQPETLSQAKTFEWYRGKYAAAGLCNIWRALVIDPYNGPRLPRIDSDAVVGIPEYQQPPAGPHQPQTGETT